MNRLKKSRVYLVGAMDRVPDRGSTWRESITPFLENIGIEIFNPLKKTNEIGKEDEASYQYKQKLKKQKKFDALSKLMKTIRSTDLRLVDISDFLIVNLDLDTHPCGTYEEIFWANRQKKPIIIHMEQGKRNAPDWLFGTIPHDMIFSNWEEIKEYLLYINKSPYIETFDRWYFT
jgi:nucleoside 2-deoxyribosyltransferase